MIINAALNPITNRQHRSLLVFLSLLVIGLGAILLLNHDRLILIRQTAAISDITKRIEQQTLHILTLAQKAESAQATGETAVTAQAMRDIRKQTETGRELADLLEQGGKYIYPYYHGIFLPGSNVVLPAKTQYSPQALKDFLTVRQDYAQAIDNALQRAPFDRDAARHLRNLAETDRIVMLHALSTLYEHYMQHSEQRIQYDQCVQIAVVLLLIICSIFFAVYSQRLIREAAGELALAYKDTDDILRSVHEGHFLLNHDLVIGNRYSAKLQEIIGTNEIACQPLETVLQSIISEKDMEVTEAFIGQLFNENVIEALIGDLNPLTRVKAVVMKDGAPQTRYLSFQFSRIYEDGHISKVLGSVRDITKETELEKCLTRERQENDGQMDMLTDILPIRPGILQQFIHRAYNSCENINHILRYQGSDKKSLQEKIKTLLTETHQLKAEASAVNLTPFVDICAEMEQCLQALKNRTELSGNHFLPLAIRFEQLLELTGKISRIYRRLHRDEPLETLGESSNGLLLDPKNLTRFAEQIAQRNNRIVKLDCCGLDTALPLNTQLILKDLIVQLLRNAVVHGIESPTEREKGCKPDTGHIKILLEKNNKQQYCLTVSDDGHGIDFDKLRVLALQNPQFTGRTPESIRRNELLKFMLSLGVSTRTETGEDAGCGIGTEIIHECTRKLNGRLSIQSQDRKGTAFRIIFTL